MFGTTTSIDSYSTFETPFKVGIEYILVLSKISSVYFEDTYQIIGDTFIELDDKGDIVEYQRYHKEEQIQYASVDDFANYALTVVDPEKERPIIGVAYTDSKSLQDIVNVTQYAVTVVISDIYKELPSKEWDIYLCKVTETFRGVTEADVLVLIFKDTVTIGNEYLLLLNKENESSSTYSLSSVYSVVDVETQRESFEEIVSMIAE